MHGQRQPAETETSGEPPSPEFLAKREKLLIHRKSSAGFGLIRRRGNAYKDVLITPFGQGEPAGFPFP
jgi:hypothetical protein